MNFREITEQDYSYCAKNLVAAYAGDPWFNTWTEEEALRRISATMSGFNARGYVIEDNGTIVAMCLGRIDYYFSNMHQFCIDEFSVIPSYQGLGIGKKLMTFVSNVMKNQEISKIFLITGSETVAKFYSKNGFIQTTDGIMMELDI